MRMVRVSDQACVVEQLTSAESYFSRLKGLIGTKSFPSGNGLLFPRCNSIHMWMMSIPIDVVFLKIRQSVSERQWEVVGTRENLRPWKILPVTEGSADDVLELPAGSVSQWAIKRGEVLCIVS